MLSIITPAATNDLTTLATARAEIGATVGTISDADVLALVGQASGACARACNRSTFGKEVLRQTEQSGTEGGIILARDLNVTVQAVTAAGLALTSDDWQVEDGQLWRISAGYPYGWQYGLPVVIDYTAGFSLIDELPPDIERACLLVLRAWYFARGRDPSVRSISSEGIGMTQFASASSDAGGMPPDALALLAPWRRLPGF